MTGFWPPQRLLHGGDWNPDQWLHEPATIDQDLDLLQAAGCQTVSVGIFAWAALEPAPGDYRLEWLGDLLDRLAGRGMQAILATPSGSLPTWLCQRSPEVLRVDGEGRRHPWALRHHHCPTSPALREAVAAIDGRLAAAFGDHPALILWHLGNEFGGTCHCELCIAAFQDWLRQRYGSLSALDQAWWNAFWSHQPGDWRQIRPDDPSNDGKVLDWRRFVSRQHIAFICHERDCVRAHPGGRPVTTNIMGLRPTIDLHALGRELDVQSIDCYPPLGGDGDLRQAAADNALDLDLCRSMGGGQSFLLMECTPSVVNKTAYPLLKRPGVHRAQMLQALAHGADGTLMFQVRAGRGGREKYHGALLGHAAAGQDRVYAEVADWGRELPRYQSVVGSRVHAPVALIADWDCWWALEAGSGPYGGDDPSLRSYREGLRSWYRALWRHGLGVDLLPRGADLRPYRLCIAPQAFVVDPAQVASWAAWVHDGGVLLTTWGSGHVEPTGLCQRGGWPGAGLGELLGVHFHEWDGPPPEAGQEMVLNDGRRCAVELCAELLLLTAPETEVLATYAHSFYAGDPAWTRRRVGRGSALHLGACCDQAGREAVIDRVLVEAGLAAGPRRRGGYRWDIDWASGAAITAAVIPEERP